MLPEQSGNYQARPMKWKVGTSSKGAVEFAVEFNFFGFWDGATWQPVDFDMAGYFYLITKEGKVNETTVKQVEEAFGWNRRNGVAWLSAAPELPDCQTSVDFESYEGKMRAKVKWLNPFGHDPNAGGIGASDPQEVASIDAKYGHLFRASAPAAAPSRTSAPAKPSNGSPTSPAKRAAWDKFSATFANLPKESREREWKEAVSAYRPGKLQTLWSDDDWKQFAADDFVRKVENPLSTEQVFTEESIPF